MVTTLANAATDLAWFLERARPSLRRTMRRFAEEEIIIPDGPFEGRTFSCARQPYTGLWFDAVDSGLWPRSVATGPTQSGKTLASFVIPLLYHLFEIGETTICGLPDMDMAADKWREDILPAIERSRYRDLLPTRGGGSRGGRVESIQFLNGATLKFMSGGGGDKSRAGFTARVVVITETDGMDEAGVRSRESDKITQLEARTRAYGSRKRIYMECTVSTETGRTWTEYQNGTRSRIVLPCPHCRQWVAPERECLVGWQSAANQVEARQSGAFACPNCGELWNEEERTRANQQGRLLHGDQSIGEDGEVEGESPATDTLGFRWSAVHNMFLTAGDIAADEWRASRSPDEENAEREMRQFVWCIPVAAAKWDETALDGYQVASRVRQVPRGIVPEDTSKLTMGIDLGKYLCHWVLVAWSEGACGHIVDYGRVEVPSREFGVEQALMHSLHELRDEILAGWPRGNAQGQLCVPDAVWIDAGYMTDVVYRFCVESRQDRNKRRFLPAVGRGAGQQRQQWYNRPTATGSLVKHIGEGYHINWLAAEKVHLVEVNADHWKTWVHQRLATPISNPGAMTLYQAAPQEHLSLAKHLTAETKTEEFVAGKGVVVRWERVRKQNHWLDALYNACAAGHFYGVRVLGETPAQPESRPTLRQLYTEAQQVRRPDGSPWLGRWQR